MVGNGKENGHILEMPNIRMPNMESAYRAWEEFRLAMLGLETQEAKTDAGKLELDLVPTQIIRDIAEVRMYGNQKYGDSENWRTVELRRYINALLRHTLAFIDAPDSVDEESGIAHYKHMACNMAFICEMMGGKSQNE